MDYPHNSYSCRGGCQRPQCGRQTSASSPLDHTPCGFHSYSRTARPSLDRSVFGSCQTQTRTPKSDSCQQTSRSSGAPSPMPGLQPSAMFPVGMTYTPWQEFTRLYEWDQALIRGTLFADLDKPFLMTSCPQGGACS